MLLIAGCGTVVTEEEPKAPVAAEVTPSTPDPADTTDGDSPATPTPELPIINDATDNTDTTDETVDTGESGDTNDGDEDPADDNPTDDGNDDDADDDDDGDDGDSDDDTPPPPPPPPPPLAPSNLTAVWANTGEDKVTQDDLRATQNAGAVTNSTWDGTTIRTFGAKNEVVAFSVILESGTTQTANVSVEFNQLIGPNGATIRSAPVSAENFFHWVGRPIELFYVRALPIKGLSKLFYENYYDERHVPARFRRPWTGSGAAESGTGWANRPDHDKRYPDIAVPIELEPTFTIAAGTNQSLWADIYIDKTLPAGLYTGEFVVREAGLVTHRVPVELTVRDFTLPDTPTAKTMLFLGYQDINTRYLASREPFPYAAADVAQSELVRNRHFQLAHRHKIALIDADYGNDPAGDAPRPEWLPRLSGTLFTAPYGYAGPGEGVGNGVYAVGAYGQFGVASNGWLTQGVGAIRAHSDAWANWFAANAPTTEYFVYMNDECGGFSTTADCYAALESWAAALNGNPGAGKALRSLATLPIIDAVANIPSLDIPTSPATVGIASLWQNAVDLYTGDPAKRVYYYNSRRPISGSFGIEDDGVALREIAWSQYKKRIDRWFYWESTYYNNYQGGMGQTNVFAQAQTFGGFSGVDPVQGETGWNYANGDGVLFYPGTDSLFPAESYGIAGPIASLRLKHWRRGIQDADYLAMAAAIDPAAVQLIMHTLIPTVLWEMGVDNPADPTYLHADIPWPTDPDIWESARQQLADIIAP
ncbi:MAG: DUF4091 domain-containing protein [Deltaproteobacteria bacterium]|nr:DUF4091 domain-containing protein [Deltaproteobacteria bacterium]